jgi:ubiquinone/menaquinone biosynthesis C-methylase UbiE
VDMAHAHEMTDVGRVVEFYEDGVEEDRLLTGVGRLEFARSQRLLERFLPPAPADVLDVGGGPGLYSSWLAAAGYDVHLVDPVPRHVDQARSRALEHRFAVHQGDARDLPFDDQSFDAVILFGPLYHLLNADERSSAWREAVRVTRLGGRVSAAAISRTTPVVDGIRAGWIADREHLARVASHLAAGPYPEAMGSAFMHRPEELLAEAQNAGLVDVTVTAVEGPFWLLGDLDVRATDEDQWRLLMAAIESIDTDPALLGASNHLFVSGVRP